MTEERFKSLLGPNDQHHVIYILFERFNVSKDGPLKVVLERLTRPIMSPPLTLLGMIDAGALPVRSSDGLTSEPLQANRTRPIRKSGDHHTTSSGARERGDTGSESGVDGQSVEYLLRFVLISYRESRVTLWPA